MPRDNGPVGIARGDRLVGGVVDPVRAFVLAACGEDVSSDDATYRDCLASLEDRLDVTAGMRAAVAAMMNLASRP
jgi:hypothetical protein